MSPNPAFTALFDQTQAAATHATAALHAYAQRENATIQHRHLTGARAAIYTRYAAHAVTRTLTPCPHLHPRRPQPQYWAAWQPGRLECGPCHLATADRIAGTVDDRRCDHCRQVRSWVYANQVLTPALIVTTPPVAQGPTLLVFGLCAPCARDTSPPPAPPAARRPGRRKPKGRSRR